MKIAILAAGQGKRLNGTPYEGTPKSLIKFYNQKSSIEMLIDDIRDIDKSIRIEIVTGYKSKQFEYLSYRYSNIKTVFNPDFNEPSNQYSLLKVLGTPPDSDNMLIIDADTVILDEYFLDDILRICEYNIANGLSPNIIFTCDKFNSETEWVVHKSKYGISVEENTNKENTHITSGVVYLGNQNVRNDLYYYLKRKSLNYWDDYYMDEENSHNFTEIYIPGFEKVLEIDSESDIDRVNELINCRGNIRKYLS